MEGVLACCMYTSAVHALSQVMGRNPNDLSSPFQVDLWVRYMTADALQAVLKNEEEPVPELEATDKHTASAGSPAVSVGLGCPVVSRAPAAGARRPRNTLPPPL